LWSRPSSFLVVSKLSSEIAFGQPCSFERWPDIPFTFWREETTAFSRSNLNSVSRVKGPKKDVEEIPGGHLVALSNSEGLTERLLAYEESLTMFRMGRPPRGAWAP
jgi:hypothetical protein